MAAGDGGAAVEPPVGDREVEQRRVVDPDVDHVEPGREHAGAKASLSGGDEVRLSMPRATVRPPAPPDEGAVGAAHLSKTSGVMSMPTLPRTS